MKHLRYFVLILGLCALGALSLKLPGPSKFFHVFNCPICSSESLYLPLLGSGYFAVLIAIFLLFTNFPAPWMARTGLIGAVLLMFILTFIDFPQVCLLCLVAHCCHILIWTIWVVSPSLNNRFSYFSMRKRVCLMLVFPISLVAMLGLLNFTLMTSYNRVKQMPLHIGGDAPIFAALTSAGSMVSNKETSPRIMIHFISLDCSHCEQQLSSVKEILPQIRESAYRFVNVVFVLPKERIESLSDMEWIEDQSGALHELFRVSDYPTLFVIGADYKIVQTISGVHEDFKNLVLTTLFK